MTTKIILSDDRFRSALKIYAQTTKHGAMDLIGTYKRNETGDWGAEIGDGQTFLAANKSALRSKIAAHVN